MFSRACRNRPFISRHFTFPSVQTNTFIIVNLLSLLYFFGGEIDQFSSICHKAKPAIYKKNIKKWYSVVNKSAMHPPALGRLLQKYLDCCGLFQILSTENYMLVIIKAKRCKILWLSFKRTLLMNWFTLDKESDLLKKVKSCAKLKEISSPVVYAFPLLV